MGHSAKVNEKQFLGKSNVDQKLRSLASKYIIKSHTDQVHILLKIVKSLIVTSEDINLFIKKPNLYFYLSTIYCDVIFTVIFYYFTYHSTIFYSTIIHWNSTIFYSTIIHWNLIHRKFQF